MSKKFRFRVTGARGAVYETTTYAEAKRLAGKRGVIERIGDKNPHCVSNPYDEYEYEYEVGDTFYDRDTGEPWKVERIFNKGATTFVDLGSNDGRYSMYQVRYREVPKMFSATPVAPWSNPSKKNSLTVNSIRSKKGPTYKLQISGSVNGVEVNGETTPVYIGLDEVTPRLSRDISIGRVNRSDGSGKKLTTAMNMAVEKAVYKELERLDKEVTAKPNPHLADTYSKVHAILKKEGGAAGLKALKPAFPAGATNIDKALPPHHKVPGVVRHGDGDYLKVKSGYEKDVTRYTNPSLPSGMSRELRSLPVGKTVQLNGKRVRRLDKDHWSVDGLRHKLANATVAVMGG